MSFFETVQSLVHGLLMPEKDENRLPSLVLALLLLALHCCCEKGWKPRLEDYTVCPTLFHEQKCCFTLQGVFSIKTIHCVHYWEVACELKWKKFIFTPIFTHLFWFFEFCSTQLFIGPRKTFSCYFVDFEAFLRRFWWEIGESQFCWDLRVETWWFGLFNGSWKITAVQVSMNFLVNPPFWKFEKFAK